MDFSRPASPTRQIHESRQQASERPSHPRALPDRTAASQASRRSMAIPNAHVTEAPPPLPPPRYIEDFEHGLDPGWTWANSQEGHEFGKMTLAPIRHGSSLQGGYLHRTEGFRPEDLKTENDMDIDQEYGRRASSVSTLRSLSDLSKSQELGSSYQDHNSPAAYPPTYPLQGERPLVQRSFEHSSNQYDKHLLSKIDKAHSSHLSRLTPRSDSLPISGSFARPDVYPRSLSSVDFPSPLGDGSPRHMNSSLPPLSPKVSSGWGDYRVVPILGQGSGESPPVTESDKWQGSRQQEGFRNHGLGVGSSLYDETNSMSSRSNRGSYDQGLLTESDLDSQSDETRAFRHLKLEDLDRGHSIPEVRLSRQANKRRKRSTSRERVDDLPPSTQLSPNFDYNQRTSFRSGFPRSPDSQHQPQHGSVSSVSSSGPRHGSYASSAGFSVGGSSITSYSSFDKPSPGGVSPRSDIDAVHDSPHTPSTVIAQASTSLPTRPSKTMVVSESKQSTSMPGRNATHGTARGKTSTKATGAFVCACCPKKPKRFPTAEELQVHTTEKQFECVYCGNRFKNKNEAERHQNSLHLRLHSWSCAAIPGPEAAFHPANAASAQNQGFAPTDSCGYCGEEFPNSPRPDWTARQEHLTVVHKFRECNKSKKFYRADHFRQHLKHSHAGTSGKWTNMLENACVKDEAPTDDAFTNASDSSSNEPGLTPASAAGTSGLQGGTIDEEDDEA